MLCRDGFIVTSYILTEIKSFIIENKRTFNNKFNRFNPTIDIL